MTTLAALIPRLRYRTGRIVSIRCIACRTWRKPRHFDRRANTCRTCVYGAAHKRVLDRATRHA